jgi:membrane-associated phospholipid phosphatase
MIRTPTTTRAPTTPRRLATRLVGLVLLGWGLGVVFVHVLGSFVHANLDRPVDRWFHHHHVRLVTKATAWVSPLGATPVVLAVVVVVIAAVALRRQHRSRPLTVALALAYAGGSTIALAVKLAVRKGQAEIPGGLGGIAQLAFPSGHATLAAAVYGTMAALLLVGAAATTGNGRRLRTAGALALVGLIVAIGVARVYRGQHDPTDVLAGWLLGGLWARAVTASIRRAG